MPKSSFLELSHSTCRLSICFLEVLASQRASCEVWLSLWVSVWHHTAFAGGLESWQCGHSEWAVFTQWWQDAPMMDGCLTSVQRTGSTCFCIISTEEAASSSLPRQLPCVSPQPTACLTHSSPNLLDANDREDVRTPETSIIACGVVTFCYPGTWPEFHSMLSVVCWVELASCLCQCYVGKIFPLPRRQPMPTGWGLSGPFVRNHLESIVF